MSTARRFEDLIAWQKARDLACRIYGICGDGALSKDFGLRNQLQRAAVSVMSNIAEGFERGRVAEFHQSLSFAKGSCAEVRSLLYVAKDVGYVDASTFDALAGTAEEVARVLGGLRASVAAKSHKRTNKQ